MPPAAAAAGPRRLPRALARPLTPPSPPSRTTIPSTTTAFLPLWRPSPPPPQQRAAPPLLGTTWEMGRGPRWGWAPWTAPWGAASASAAALAASVGWGWEDGGRAGPSAPNSSAAAAAAPPPPPPPPPLCLGPWSVGWSEAGRTGTWDGDSWAGWVPGREGRWA